MIKVETLNQFPNIFPAIVLIQFEVYFNVVLLCFRPRDGESTLLFTLLVEVVTNEVGPKGARPSSSLMVAELLREHPWQSPVSYCCYDGRQRKNVERTSTLWSISSLSRSQL